MKIAFEEKGFGAHRKRPQLCGFWLRSSPGRLQSPPRKPSGMPPPYRVSLILLDAPS